jgi:hypothetical protein
MDTLLSIYPNILAQATVELFRTGGLIEKKHVLTIARYRGLPNFGHNMFSITSPTIRKLRTIVSRLLRDPYYSDKIEFTNPLSSPLDFYIDAELYNPIIAGQLIMMACISTPTDTEQEEIRLASYMKEINVMESSTQPSPLFDFTPFYGNYNTPIHPGVAPNPKHARYVHEAIDSWIRILQTSSPQKPKMSSKLLPTHTRIEMDTLVHDILCEPAKLATQASLEYMMGAYGLGMEGPAELKQRWYMNGPSPRSYFVAGPSNYNDSRLTKDLWNLLVDSLEPTHRRSRVNPKRIHIPETHYALFYDLTSFTSNMALQRPFLESLAMYCQGVSIPILSTVHGHIYEDLGSLISVYNRTNTFPEYRCPALPTFLPQVHGVAGFLGVYGNIATCTFLHGATLLQLASDSEHCGCAGDDAVIVLDNDTDESTVFACVSLLGIIAPEKTFNTLFPDVIYLKRSVWTNKHGYLRLMPLFLFPSMLPFMTRHELSPYREKAYSRKEKLSTACSSLSSSFKSVALLEGEYQDEAQSVLQRYYRLLSIPNGNVPQFSRRNSGVFMKSFIPSLNTCGSKSFVSDTISLLYPGWCILPNREVIDERRLFPRCTDIFDSSGGGDIAILRRFGIIEVVKKQDRVYYGLAGLSKLIEEYTAGRALGRSITTYRLIRDIPQWLMNGDWHVYGEYTDRLGDLVTDFRVDCLEENVEVRSVVVDSGSYAHHPPVYET